MFKFKKKNTHYYDGKCSIETHDHVFEKEVTYNSIRVVQDTPCECKEYSDCISYFIEDEKRLMIKMKKIEDSQLLLNSDGSPFISNVILKINNAIINKKQVYDARAND